MTDPLERVRDAAAAAQDARTELRAALLAAHKKGASLRQLAEASGLSHETVRTLLKRSDKTA